MQAEGGEEREKAWPALLLAWIAGGVDAIGYLALVHLFTAHMSGNTAAMGASLGQQQWKEAWRRAFPIPVFVIGVAMGAFLAEAAKRRRGRAPFALLLGLEAGLLLGFLLFGGTALQEAATPATMTWRFYLLVALPALAMGIQNAALRKVGGQTVRTTYISGTLTNMAEAGVTYLYGLRDQARGRRLNLMLLRASFRQPAWRRMLLSAGIWCAFAAGAILGGYGEQRWGLRALLLPLGGLALLIAVDLRLPISAP